MIQYRKQRARYMQRILNEKWGNVEVDEVDESDPEAAIRFLHHRLQRECGHRGVGRDSRHIDNQKGPPQTAVALYKKLLKVYDNARADHHSFRPPVSTESGKAVWRDLEFSCFSQIGDDGLLMHIFGVLGPGQRTSVEIGYFPHEANTVALVTMGGFRGLLLDGGTDPLIARSWFAGVDKYLGILSEQHALPKANRTILTPTADDLRKSCAPWCLESCYNVHCSKAALDFKKPKVRRMMVTAENVRDVIDREFKSDAVSLDLLSVDIDGMEYY
eukprot:CAMPEP_0113692096 /NCGR_PEP_ID=MMETSP0038_2-20120614/18874_1 /TAXON_ID=2898 /ORGANISM="Cryptomonas paramecium" /LENGTH=272 /DNA_ID=CAMNT_0000613929 /DNA_START=173 /DNA_END=988 /DNA_ORIENTATION=+ /assembly_acc=CAM_ASM_000170